MQSALCAGYLLLVGTPPGPAFGFRLLLLVTLVNAYNIIDVMDGLLCLLVGLAVVALLARSTQVNRSYLAEHFTPYAAMRWSAIAAQPGDPVSSALLLAEIGRQAAAISYSNDFYVLATATLLALPLVLALKVDRPGSTGSGTRNVAADAGH